ncbi:MAG: LCP family protein [Acidimicrobiia bacterium]
MAAGLVAVTAGALGVGLGATARARIDEIPRIDSLAGVLSPAGPIENYLLVGSDSRAGADPTDPDFGGIGDESQTGGKRSDTIMVLRYDRGTGDVALVSLPRDLWVEIAGGGSNRINAAYAQGPEVLVATVQTALGIPVHHYVEVDFQGFKRLVDAVGGVEVCFEFAARDLHTGLNIPDPGCYVLDGVQGLQYARSRYYEQFVDGDWQIDGTADIGRTARQQAFIEAAMTAAIDSTTSNPFRAASLIDAGVDSLLVDTALDVPTMARQLRPVASSGAQRYALAVRGTEIDGKSVLVLQDEALAVIAYFQGGPPPVGS